jgi:geranylgeranyl transferase type-2 subunit alpha
MHGRRKVKTTEDKERERRELEKKKCLQYSSILNDFWERKSKNDYSEDMLQLTEKILDVNTECYTVWNYRRTILLEMEKVKSPEEMKTTLKEELKFLERAIAHHHKSYWVWFQRMWVTERIEVDWQRELGLCAQLLDLDARNFHCWTYRRYVADKAKITPLDELKFAMKKIEQNFSNYSAWHQRSYLLPQCYAQDLEAFKNAILGEFDLVKQALYTEPEDQSGWFYHRWLVGVSKKLMETNDFKDMLRKELETLNELLELEPNSKWTLLTKVFVLNQLEGHQAEVLQSLKRLQEIDPKHQQYYADYAAKSNV